MRRRILIIDNNVVRRLGNVGVRARLASNLRATGREFWPTAMNVLEALKSRDPRMRIRMLSTLSALAGENHALTLPTEVLKRIAEALVDGRDQIDFSEPKITAVFRDPGSVTDELASGCREHLLEEERNFREVHERAKRELRPVFTNAGGRTAWPTVRSFLDQVWTVSSHLNSYFSALWKNWGLPGQPPVELLLNNPAWRLYFDGWGAAVYAQSIAHPQLPWVETADLQQLVYFGICHSGLLATEDAGLQTLGTEILSGRYTLRRVVPLDAVT